MLDTLFSKYTGIHPENFNPNILYIQKEKLKDISSKTYGTRDFITLIFVLSGECTYMINDIPCNAKKGDIVICNPGSTHKKILSYGDEVEEFNIGFNNIFIKNLPKNHIIHSSDHPILVLKKYHEQFSRCCEEIIEESRKCEHGCELVLKSLGLKLIAVLLKEMHSGELIDESSSFDFDSNDKTSIVNTILKFMNENYMKEISLETISKNLYLSSVYISKLFKEETGDSPINYLIKVRLSKASELLKSEHTSIKSVAESVGYHDAYYFSKLFKKYYGYSPSKLLRRRELNEV